MTLWQKLVRRWTRMLMPFRYEGQEVSVCWCGGWLGPSRSPLVGECQECGTGVLRRRLTEASYERWYQTGDYRRWVMGSSEVSIGQLTKEIRRAEGALRFLSDQAFDVYGKSVMDVGSGAGGALIVARLLRANYLLGVDSDPRSEKIPATLGIQVLDSLPVADNWDRVICSHLIEHIVRPVEFLRMLAMYLSPDGCLYIETPAWTEKAEVKLPHVWYLRPQSLRLMAERAGLGVFAMTDGIQSVLRRTG